MKRTVSFAVLGTVVWLVVHICSAVALAQVFTHSDSNVDDGKPGVDADGSVNKIVVFQGGATHIFSGAYYGVYAGYTVVVQPGATIDGGQWGVQVLGENASDSRFQITGARLRRIAFAGFHGPGSFIRQSVLDTCSCGLPQGGEFTNNELNFGWIEAVSPALKAGIAGDPPRISDNVLNNAYLRIDGSAADILRNTIDDDPGDNRGYYTINLGYMKSATGAIYPTMAVQTRIIGNNVTGRGIVMNSRILGQVEHASLDNQPLSVHIEDNKVRGFLSPTGVSVGLGLELEVFTNTQVLENEFTDCTNAIVLKTEPKSTTTTTTRKPSPLFKIGNNVFSEANTHGMLFKSGFKPVVIGAPQDSDFVNAMNNYWGDPSGPKDLSNADGRYYEGKGLDVGDYISYIPFRGAEDIFTEQNVEVRLPEHHVLLRGKTYTIPVSVTYKLYSGSGILELEIKDNNGRLLVDPKPQANITAGRDSVMFQNLVLTMPQDAEYITIQSVIHSDLGLGSLSNEVKLDIQSTERNISIESITFVQEGSLHPTRLLQGTETDFTIKLSYTFVPNPGETAQIEIVPIEISKVNQYVRKAFPPTLVPAESGNHSKEIPLRLKTSLLQVNIPLEQRAFEFRFLVALKSSSGSKEEVVGRIDVHPAAAIWLNSYKPFCLLGDLDPPTLLPGRQNFFYDEWVAFGADVGWEVFTQNVADWRIGVSVGYSNRWNSYIPELTHAVKDVFIFPGRIVIGEQFVGPVVTTGKGQFSWSVTTGQPPPSNKDFYNIFVDVLTPEGICVAKYAPSDLGFLRWVAIGSASRTEKAEVPSGSPTLSLTEIPFVLSFLDNQAPGVLLGREIEGPYQKSATLAKTGGEDQGMVELGRHWVFSTNLEPGTFSVLVQLTYNPTTDFPPVSNITEDSLTVAVWDTVSKGLRFVPTQRDPANNRLTVTLRELNTPFVVGVPRSSATTADESESRVVPAEYLLYQNYPNPFNPVTIIEYALPRAGHVSIAVYNSLGQEVGVLIAGNRDAGYHSVRFDASRVASGVYFYRLQAGEFVATRKFLVIR